MIARKMVTRCSRCGQTFIRPMHDPFYILSMGLCSKCRIERDMKIGEWLKEKWRKK